jgi:cephalosporin-C deacetylase-like acetyl esterase
MQVRQKTLAIILSACFAAAGSTFAQQRLQESDLRVIRDTPAEPEYRDMMMKFLLAQAARLTSERLATFHAIQSRRDFEKWQTANRQKFLDLIGGLPETKTPLHPQITGEFQREGYIVRKVIFESLPGFYVTANLYVPTVGKPPFPAILTPLGHSDNGKAYDIYQHLFIGLVKRGYVVLSYDPLGQGERLEYWNYANQTPLLSGPDSEHAMMGIQEYLLGQDVARYFIWDGIRGLDYLSSLPEVDASRLGVTGNSGGGTLTTYISMLDPRVRVASIVTFLTSIPKKIESRELDSDADSEQDIPGLLAAGIDHTEFVGMIAPRPVLMGTATRDFFPIAGARQTYQELRELYTKLGVPDRIKMVEFDHRHMYSLPLRESTYSWFDHWLKGVDAPAHEPEFVTERDNTLQCTPTGQVVTSLGGKRVHGYNLDEADRLISRLEERRKQPGWKNQTLDSLRRLLAFPAQTPSPGVKRMSESTVGDLQIEKLLLTSETGIAVPLSVITALPGAGKHSALLFLRDRQGEGDPLRLFAPLAQAGYLVAYADVRGFGETWDARSVRESPAAYYHFRDGVDADMTYSAFFLGRPMVGMRAWDALCAAAYLGKRGDVDPAKLIVIGKGWAGLPALFAAALDRGISAVALTDSPISYAGIARADIYTQPATLMIPGALRSFDIPDVLNALTPRPLLIVNPQTPQATPMTQETAKQELADVQSAYAAAGVAKSLRVVPAILPGDTAAVLEEWVGDVGGGPAASSSH